MSSATWGYNFVDPLLTGDPGDDWEDDHAEPVHEPGGKERATQREAARDPRRLGAALLHLSHGLDHISCHEPRVQPREWLVQCRREDDFGDGRKGVGTRLVLGGISLHDAVDGRAHQDRVVAFGLLVRPR